ncbi:MULTISPECIES: sulfite exporter TauE/SafE family protein [Altibacter]|uniref:sulfite exporter TauE/SafE family protein n=1 Tax=Altibacter TaxID=1535231 RepID=UPI00055120BE|nr:MULTISPECIES: sulfite exporter TauE/SafE family protein [Altibacter]MCW8981474.1 sulfite exporter TauE/SafE family protein [Altibacter sp.]MCW9038009.1 sulfite exporter TauE/SafE family protein [Altibacter sp.]
MTEFFADIQFWLLAVLFTLGAAAFTLSTISGGGGALMQIPILNLLIGTSQTAPVLNLGTMISRPSRIIIFWKHIVWSVFWYYVPAAMLGAILAAWLFTEANIVWIQIVVGLFLVSTFFQYRFGKKERSFPVQLWYFIPLGFFISIIGTFTGGMGPILNPFLLNVGIEKEELVGTKAAQAFFLGLAQIGSYTYFGLLTKELWIYGIALGLGATLGNLFGKILLQRMSRLAFRKWVIAIMVISGLVLLVKAMSDLL